MMTKIYVYEINNYAKLPWLALCLRNHLIVLLLERHRLLLALTVERPQEMCTLPNTYGSQGPVVKL
jgi:hypothetical protein